MAPVGFRRWDDERKSYARTRCEEVAGWDGKVASYIGDILIHIDTRSEYISILSVLLNWTSVACLVDIFCPSTSHRDGQGELCGLQE